MTTKQMDNKRDIAFWIMVVVVIVLVGYVAFFIRSESYECMSSPLVYGVSQYRASNGDFTCTCSSPFADQILVTKEGISPLSSYNILLSQKS